MNILVWYVVAVRGWDGHFLPEAETFNNEPDARAWLQRCYDKGYQWGKMYARRLSDDRYVFEREFQQRA